MLQTKKYQFWFCTGSQDLYGDECLAKVCLLYTSDAADE